MIGPLRERVTLQSPTASVDSVGDVAQDWATVAQVWARVQAIAARDEQQQAREKHVARWRVTLRHRAMRDAPRRAGARRAGARSRFAGAVPQQIPYHEDRRAER